MILYLMALFIILTSIFLERRDGGVCILTNKSLSAVSVPIPFKFDHLDVVCIEIVFNHT